MEKQIKFTSDGRKVVVIGSLNSQEKIVQEIFVVDGSEIPSGEHFVVKTLHDAPAISWKEKNLIDLENRYKKERDEWETKMLKLKREFESKYYVLREKLSYAGSVLKNLDSKAFDLLVNYISGKITHVVVVKYSTPELLEIDKFNQLYENKLRLISIFGKDDGTMQYYVGDYYDGSGGHTHFFPFTSYDEALQKHKELISTSTINDKIINLAKEYSVELDKEKVNQFYEKKRNGILASIEHINKTLENYKKDLSNIPSVC